MGLCPSLASCLATGVSLFLTHLSQDAIGHEDYSLYQNQDKASTRSLNLQN